MVRLLEDKKMGIRLYRAFLACISSTLLCGCIEGARRDASVKKPWPVWDVAFSPDGRWLAAGRGYHEYIAGGEGEVNVWQTKDWEQQASLQAPFTDMARAIAFTVDGKNVAAASDKYVPYVKGGSLHDGNVVFIWTFPDGALVKTLAFNDQFDDQHVINRGAGFVMSLAISPDGELIGLARLGGPSVVLHRNSGRIIYDVKLNSGTPYSVAFSPNGKILLSPGYRTPIIQPYEAATGKELSRFDLKDGEPVCVCYSPDGKQLAIGMAKGNVLLLAGDLSKQLRSLEVSADKESVQALAYAAKADLLAAATTTRVRLFEASTGKHLREWGKADLRASTVALSPDGKLLAVGYCGEHNVKGDWRGGYVNIWDTATGRLVKKLD